MAHLMPSPRAKFYDSNGNPVAFGKLYSYQAGTSTPLATYTDANLGGTNTNPVILDSNGEAVVWMDENSYKFVLKDSLDNVLWTADGVTTSLTGQVTTTMLAAGILTADIAGRAKMADGYVNGAKILGNCVDESKLTASVAGDGLAGGNGTPLAVNVDASSIEISADTLRVKAAGITNAMLAGSIAFSKLLVLPKWKSQTFTSSGTWVCPSGVTTVLVVGWGGGGGGHNAATAYGGGGAPIGVKNLDVSAPTSYTVTIGAGGAGGSTGAAGGDSAFGSITFKGGCSAAQSASPTAAGFRVGGTFGGTGGAASGQGNVFYDGGSAQDTANCGGGGAGPGGNGGLGGNSGNAGAAGAANSGAGGGSGFPAGIGGGAGGSGQVTVFWVENQ